MLARIGRRLFRSTLLGCVAGLLLTVDGMEFVHSRTALLDPLLMFWALAAFGALVVDRDRARARLAAGLRRRGAVPGSAPGWAATVAAGGRALPRDGLRHQVERPVLRRGLRADDRCCGTWAPGARRASGGRGSARWSATRCRPSPRWCWSRSASTWRRGPAGSWAATTPTCATGPRTTPGRAGSRTRSGSLLALPPRGVELPHPPRVFHPYRSNPWGWLVLARPVSYYYEGPKLGQDGCMVDACSQAITALGTPAIWWAACLALPGAAVPVGRAPRLAGRRDPRRRRRRVPAVVLLPAPHDLLVLRGRVRAVPGAGGHHVPRADPRRPARVRRSAASGARPPSAPTCCSRSPTSPGCCRFSRPRPSRTPTGPAGCGGRLDLRARAFSWPRRASARCWWRSAPTWPSPWPRRPRVWSAGRARCWPRPPTPSPTRSTRSSCSPA